MTDQPEIPVETLAETENFTIWRAQEPDGEIQYHIDMNNVTIHFFEEEWQELLQLLQSLDSSDKPQPPVAPSSKKKK